MQSMQLTEWLIVIFAVAIVVVLVDGVRRKLAERRTRVVMKLDKNIPQDFNPDTAPNAELPNGGARAVERAEQAVPSLRTLQARRKPLFKSFRNAADEGTTRAVPVLLDTVDVEEERIEHTNVFADPHAVPASFQRHDFAAEENHAHETPAAPAGTGGQDDDELIDGLDEEYEEDPMLEEPIVARKQPGYMETRYQGRDDDDDDLDDEEEFDDEEDEEDDEDEEDFDEFDDEEFDDEDEEDEDDEDFDDEDEDDYDDEDEDDDFDDEEEEEEDDEEEDEEDLDELEGLPEDDWGNEEEDVLVDDYENEPMPLGEAFDKAASQLDKVASHAATQLDRVATQAASQLDKVAAQAATQFDKVASHAATQLDKAASHAANQFKRPPPVDKPRIEPGFGNDVGGEESFDEVAFTEDFSAAFDEDDVSPVRESVAPRPATPARAATLKRDQGELFPSREAPVPREAPTESRLMAALQKAVPRSQPAPEPVAAAPVPQEVIIINVMARAGQVFHGGDLLSVLQEQGMRLGDMSIFHRHADSQGSGPAMFSMANMVKPGTFDLATMESFNTPGVSFFLQMPNKLGNMACFEKMLATASAVRTAFDAELKDEHRSVFTRQTVEHCRQRVRDFELKLLSRK
jgi:cell division protein ZipA